MEKKIAAAVTGVLYYLMSEEEPVPVKPGAGVSPWAVHARQSIMQMRNLLQRRVLKR